MTVTIFTVTQVTALVRSSLSAVPELEDVLVEGEVSNLSRPASGHLYFTLKDAGAALKCVCFRGTLAGIPFRTENGITVVVHGRVDVYDQVGAYQLYADRIEPSGVGALALAIEQRKRQLAAEGLFDESLKRPLPLLPHRVVVVTSPTGAAFRDVCNVIRRRAPGTDIVISPAVVQGAESVSTLLAALERAQQVPGAGVILVVRGGGSIEDLMSFNDADLARAIRRSILPVVVGVGHETDTTIADLVADRRASTPSAAAELAVPSMAHLHADLEQRSFRLRQAARHAVTTKRRLSENLSRRLLSASPQRRLAGMRQDVDLRAHRLLSAVTARVGKMRRDLDRDTYRLQSATPRHRVQLLRAEVAARQQRLAALSPFAVLKRGYSITVDSKTGKVVTCSSASPGQRLTTRIADGEIDSAVAAVRRQGENA